MISPELSHRGIDALSRCVLSASACPSRQTSSRLKSCMDAQPITSRTTLFHRSNALRINSPPDLSRRRLFATNDRHLLTHPLCSDTSRPKTQSSVLDPRDYMRKRVVLSDAHLALRHCRRIGARLRA